MTTTALQGEIARHTQPGAAIHDGFKRHAPAGPPDHQTRRPRIAERAFEIFQSRQRSGGRGDDVSDWLQAEREVAAADDDALAPCVDLLP